jgi:hypothetical protein
MGEPQGRRRIRVAALSASSCGAHLARMAVSSTEYRPRDAECGVRYRVVAEHLDTFLETPLTGSLSALYLGRVRRISSDRRARRADNGRSRPDRALIPPMLAAVLDMGRRGG